MQIDEMCPLPDGITIADLPDRMFGDVRAQTINAVRLGESLLQDGIKQIIPFPGNQRPFRRDVGDGRLLWHAYATDADRFAPLPQSPLHKQVIFLGHEDYQGMREYVAGEVSKLSSFSFTDYEGKKVSGLEAERIERLLRGINFIEKAYGGKKRKTGEPEFAHILRVLNNGINFVSDCAKIDDEWQVRMDKLPLNWRKPYFFSPETIEILLWTILLHDFTEPDGKKYQAGSDRTTIGNIRFDKVGLNDEFTFTLTANDDQIPELSLSVNWDLESLKGIRSTLRALNSTEVEDKQAVKHIQDQRSRELQKAVQLGQFNLYNYLPVIVKCLDRLDNVATRTFKKTGSSWVPGFNIINPAPSGGIFDKAVETIDTYPEIERVLMWVMTWMYQPVFADAFGHVFPEVKRYTPSLWAEGILNGKYPDEIYATAHDPDYRGNPRW